ncbi:hypothetical protein P154DRAFT_460518 [Amniculicola lignicola CBS 123094]|uniref:DUF7580 domain-containing protein n=1 Tax=Amniculicola lignicola CBS 123094 TaxID=1392246 RepID=A0A6A5WQ04_9PLEO|nr:hypothetical protein P154DRAFT_460518 [Amniculicola lignicola CBS 123094]
MSGIEVAGLVLGAFPLLIYALESYREGAEVVGDWWRIERAYTKCKQDLKYHQLLFEGNIERFLLPLVVDDDELKLLMKNPAGTAWEDPELEKKLQERLPKAYDTFLGVMIDINKLMESLKRELGVNNPKFQTNVSKTGKLSKTNASRNDLMSYSNFEFQAKRIKFSLKKSSRERLFLQFKDANDRMRNLLESSDQIAAARRSRETAKAPSAMKHKINEFWRHAKRLHDALTKAWQCGCGSHVANLQLQHRTCDEVEFNVVFDLGSTPTRAAWRETKIKMIPNIVTASAVGISVNIQQTIPSPVHGVRWKDATLVTAPITTQAKLNQIKDLCSTLTTTCPGCFGFLDEEEHHFVIYPGSHASVTQMTTVTLEKLLQDAHSMTRRKRYYLALTLASSFLQLGSTPWLNSPLKNDSIVFLQDPTNPSSAIVEYPYIRREISQKAPTPPTEAISSLGIRLLELCFGSSLENNRFRKLLGPGDAISAPILDYAAAMQWSKMASDEAGPEFADAIDWCLRAKEHPDGSWRKDLWTKVIQPLDDCHKQMSQKIVV